MQEESQTLCGVSRAVQTPSPQLPGVRKSSWQRLQPLTPTSVPQLSWQKVTTDLFELKMTYLLIVDYFSRYIGIACLNCPTTAEIVIHLKSIFACHGIPETMISYNGTQYASHDFANFAKEYEIEHHTSSPYFAQGNGKAERAVGTINGLSNKSWDPYKALSAYRSTPLQIGYSTAEGRFLRSTVPTTRAQRIPDLSKVRAQGKQSKARQKRNHDKHHGARVLPPLQTGDRALIPERERRKCKEKLRHNPMQLILIETDRLDPSGRRVLVN